jgi:hypothetical protein
MSIVPQKLGLRVKGPVNSRKEVYIPRPSDNEVFELLRAAEYCNVVSSRQMGKTSLLFRIKPRLIEAGIKACSVDVGGYLGDVPPENADDWYQDLLQEIVDQLGLKVDVATWWRSSSSATPNRRLIHFFRDEIVARAGAPVVVFLDEIENTLKLPYTDDFFLAIRAMYNDRQREPAFEQITFCLVGVLTPNELIKNQRTTPYNIGQTIELRDFDPARDDLSALYSTVDQDPETGKQLVEAILGWTGGHPYLTMKHCAEVTRSEIKAAGDVHRLFERSCSSLEAVKSDEHFETVLRFVRERVEDNDRLNALMDYRRIYRGRRELDRTTPAYIALKLSGLVKRDDRGLLIVRNRIYRRVFTDRWATKAMPPAAKALRIAWRSTVASTILFLLSAGIWYEGIYPYQLANRLNAALAEDRYALDTYQLLRAIPFYAGKADGLWAALFDRRAETAEWEEKRDEALLLRLKALSVVPTDRRARNATLLIGVDRVRLTRTLRLPEGRLFALSGDRALAAADSSGTVRVWRVETGELVGRPFEYGRLARSRPEHIVPGISERGGSPLEAEIQVSALALSGNGRVAAVADSTGLVRLWRVETGEPIGRSIKYGSAVTALALSGDGRVVAAGDGHSILRSWRVEGGEPIGRPLKCENPAAALALSGDGRIAAVACA